MSLIGPGRKTARIFGRIQQFLQINSSFVAHAYQKVDKILRREIPACARAIRTPAQTRGGRVKLADTGFESRQCVGQPPAIRVMEMEYEILRVHTQLALQS